MLLLLVGLSGNHVGIVVSDGAGGIHEDTGYLLVSFLHVSVVIVVVYQLCCHVSFSGSAIQRYGGRFFLLHGAVERNRRLFYARLWLQSSSRYIPLPVRRCVVHPGCVEL